MKEYKIGERIVLEVQENPMTDIESCNGCYFENTPMFGTCYRMCDARLRSDGTNIMFKELKKTSK